MNRDLDWIRRMEEEMGRWADESIRIALGRSSPGNSLWVPRVDIYETEDAVVVRICAAGVGPDDIEIRLVAGGQRLVVRGIRRDDEEARQCAVRYHQLEVYTGPFERELQLPSEVAFDREAISAVAKDGFFTVILPKLAPRPSEPRTMPITEE